MLLTEKEEHQVVQLAKESEQLAKRIAEWLDHVEVLKSVQPNAEITTAISKMKVAIDDLSKYKRKIDGLYKQLMKKKSRQ